MEIMEFAGFEQDGELYFTGKEEKYAKIYKLNRNNEIQELDPIINHPLFHTLMVHSPVTNNIFFCLGVIRLDIVN